MAFSVILASLIVAMIFINRTTYANLWNYDQNRYQAHRSELENNLADHENFPNSKILRERRSYEHQRSTNTDDQSSQYLQYNPVIITKPNNEPIEYSRDFHKNTSNFDIVVRRFKPGVKIPIPHTTPISVRNNNNQYSRYSVNNPRVSNAGMLQDNSVNHEYLEFQRKLYRKVTMCIRCPSELTVVAAKNRDKVQLERPKLNTCDGNPISTGTSFRTLYGPEIGSLLKEGSHVIAGHIIHGNQTLQMCQYRVNVIVRRCPKINLPPNVEAKCLRNNAWGTTCRFTCKSHDPPYNMKGPFRAKCHDNLKWSTNPPTCEEQPRLSYSWCSMPITPKRAILDCTINGDADYGVTEGSECSYRCSNGQHRDESLNSTIVSTIVCKSGAWYGKIPFCPNTRRAKHKLQKKLSKKRKLLVPSKA